MLSFPLRLGKPLRVPTAYLAGGLGFTAGFMLAYQRSAGQLMGYKMS